METASILFQAMYTVHMNPELSNQEKPLPPIGDKDKVERELRVAEAEYFRGGDLPMPKMYHELIAAYEAKWGTYTTQVKSPEEAMTVIENDRAYKKAS